MSYEKDIKIHLRERRIDKIIEEEYHKEVIRWIEGKRSTKPVRPAAVLGCPKKTLDKR